MEFIGFPKMARLSRDVIISEKIDGTNACIFIGEDGEFLVGSRTRWITPEQDNHGFAKWAYENRDDLMKLGPGRHFGEWWGCGINRGYGLKERRFSLFNVQRWCSADQEPKQIITGDPRIVKFQQQAPACCWLVPVLWHGEFDTSMVSSILESMREQGSTAAPGYTNPEGVVVFHTAGNVGFKKTLDKDEMPKAMHNVEFSGTPAALSPEAPLERRVRIHWRQAMKAAQLRAMIGKEVEWEHAHDYNRGTCLVRKAIITDVKGKNVAIDDGGMTDWVYADRLINLREVKPNVR